MTPDWYLRYEQGVHKRYKDDPFGIPPDYKPNYCKVVNIIRQSFKDPFRINEVLWVQLAYADTRIKQKDLQNACYFGWDYNDETRKLRRILQSLIDPTPFCKKDYL